MHNFLRSTLWWLAASFLAAGCVPAGLPTTVLPPEIRYDCQQGGPLVVLRAPDGRQAEAIFQGRRIVLPRVDSAAQEKYANGRVTLYLDGEKALVTENMRRDKGCLPWSSNHELPDGTTYGKQLRTIHAPDDAADDGPHDLLHPCQADGRRLLHDEARFGELERLHEVEVHATVRQLDYDVRECVPVRGGILSPLESIK